MASISQNSQSTGGVWGFLGDLLGAATAIGTNLIKPKDQQVIYVPKTQGLSENFLYICVIGLFLLVVFKLVGGRRKG